MFKYVISILLFFIFSLNAYSLTDEHIADMYAASSANAEPHHDCFEGNFKSCEQYLEAMYKNDRYSEHDVVILATKYLDQMYKLASQSGNADKMITTIIMSKAQNYDLAQKEASLNLIAARKDKLANFARYFLYRTSHYVENSNLGEIDEEYSYLKLSIAEIGYQNTSFDYRILKSYKFIAKTSFDKYEDFIKQVDKCKTRCKPGEFYLTLIDLIKDKNQLTKAYSLVSSCSRCKKDLLLQYATSNANFRKSFKDIDVFLSSTEYKILKEIGYSIKFRASGSIAKSILQFESLNFKGEDFETTISHVDVSESISCAKNGGEYTKKVIDIFTASNVTSQNYECKIQKPIFYQVAKNSGDFTSKNSFNWKYAYKISVNPVRSYSAATSTQTPNTGKNNSSGSYKIVKSYTGGFNDFGLAESRKVWIIECSNNSKPRITTSADGSKWYRLDGMSSWERNTFEDAAKKSCN